MDMQTTAQPVVCNEARLSGFLEIATVGVNDVVVPSTPSLHTGHASTAPALQQLA
jgi:hypothetical protein